MLGSPAAVRSSDIIDGAPAAASPDAAAVDHAAATGGAEAEAAAIEVVPRQIMRARALAGLSVEPEATLLGGAAAPRELHVGSCSPLLQGEARKRNLVRSSLVPSPAPRGQQAASGHTPVMKFKRGWTSTSERSPTTTGRVVVG